MKLNIIIFCCCLPFLGVAQKYYGITGGIIANDISISLTPKANVTQPYDLGFGPTFGGVFGMKLNRFVGVNSTLKYQSFVATAQQSLKLKQRYIALSVSPEFYFNKHISLLGGVSVGIPLNNPLSGEMKLIPMGHLGLAVSVNHFRIELTGIRSIGPFVQTSSQSYRTNYYHRAAQLTISYLWR